MSNVLTTGIVLVIILAGINTILSPQTASNPKAPLGEPVRAMADAYVVHLSEGWSLVSLPFVGLHANSLPGLGTGDLVVHWNSTLQYWDKIFIKGVSLPHNDIVMNPWEAYWFFANDPRTVNITDGVVADPAIQIGNNVTVPLVGGWFMAGFLFNTTLSASDIPGAFTGGDIIAVASFDPVAKKYTTWLSAFPVMNDFTVIPGMGYWCYATGSGTLDFFPN